MGPRYRHHHTEEEGIVMLINGPHDLKKTCVTQLYVQAEKRPSNQYMYQYSIYTNTEIGISARYKRQY